MLDLPSLKLFRRKLAKLTTIYKIINDNLHIPSISLITNHRHSRNGCFTQLDYNAEQLDSYKFFFPPLLSYGTPFPLYVMIPQIRLS